MELPSADLITSSHVSLAIKLAKEIVNPALRQYNKDPFATLTPATVKARMAAHTMNSWPGPQSNEDLHHVHDPFAWRLMNLVIVDTWRSSAVEGVVPLGDMFSLSLGVGVDPLGSSYLLFPRPYMK